MDSLCLLVVCSGGSREGARGEGPPLLLDYADARRAEIFLQAPPPLPQIISGSGSASDVESVIGPFTLMKASLFATEMQLTFKIILDIAR